MSEQKHIKAERKLLKEVVADLVKACRAAIWALTTDSVYEVDKDEVVKQIKAAITKAAAVVEEVE